LPACAADKAAAARKLADEEHHHRTTADELAQLMKKLMELGAAKAKTDALNTELQGQAKRDAQEVLDLRDRVKDLEVRPIDTITRPLSSPYLAPI